MKRRVRDRVVGMKVDVDVDVDVDAGREDIGRCRQRSRRRHKVNHPPELELQTCDQLNCDNKIVT